MSKDPNSTQLAVVGGGPGGYPAAFLAADLGMQVTLIDLEPKPGGVCLYRGCIPSKTLLHVAKLLGETHQAAEWGIQFPDPEIDLDQLRARKEKVVQQLTGGLGQLVKQRKISYIQGRATFLDARTLKIQDSAGQEEILNFQHAIVATGSRPATLPNLSLESERLIDSTSALELAGIPKTMLVIGGGYIGLELGTVYAALGTQVSVVEMMPGLLPGADRDLVRVLSKRLEKLFHSMMLNTTVAEIGEVKGGIQVRLEGDVEEAEQTFEKILVAVGRKPNSSGLGLENTRVEINQRGFVKVNQQRQTAEPNIYAVGDIAGEPMLAHKATHEGLVAVEAIAGHKVAYEPHAIPAVVFTDPELAWCGLTETQAKQENISIEVARFPWGASGRATTLGRNDGLTKLIIEPQTERVLGVGLAGAGAGELIAEGVLAVEMAALASDLRLSIHPHPTLSETIMEAAEVFFGQSTHAYRPKRG
ncbi:MAG: dihydrolipoyl dehydrogenase [Anaerolineales bacterium]|nr:MAG: dihydrolipoyl dehydrogenase [Anaerolineales bacterium]